MKYTLATIISLTLFAESCNQCGTCTTTITTTVNVSTPGYPQTSKTTFNACGKDYRDANGKQSTSTSTSGGITATAKSKTTCTLN